MTRSIRTAVFVFLTFAALAHFAHADPPPALQPLPTTNAFNIGRLVDPQIDEASGVVASRQYPGVYWTHNDSDNPPQLFAVDRTGKLINAFMVDRKNRDWEDIAIDSAGHLFIGEIGNNFSRHSMLACYQLDEPDPHVAQKPGDLLHVTKEWKFTFPVHPFDCESLFIWGDNGYVISKLYNLHRAGLYRFPLSPMPQKQPFKLEEVCTLPIRFPCTAADISIDGRQLAVLTVKGPYIFDLPKPGDVQACATLKTHSVLYYDLHEEGVCFVDEGLLAVSEFRNVYLFRWKDFGMKPPATTAPATQK